MPQDLRFTAIKYGFPEAQASTHGTRLRPSVSQTSHGYIARVGICVLAAADEAILSMEGMVCDLRYDHAMGTGALLNS